MMKNKSFFAWLGGITAVMFTGIGAYYVASATETEPAAKQPSEYKKSEVFVSLDNSISEVVDGATFPAYCQKTTPVGTSETGVALYTESGGANFSYANPIDMVGKTKNDRLIECFAVSGEDYAIMDSLSIKLTDTENVKNTVELYIHTQGDIYARVNYRGKSLSLSNEGTNYGKYLWNNNYGAWCSSYKFSSTKTDGSVRPFSFAIDYEEKEFYLVMDTDDNFLMLDLDEVSHVGQGDLWDGFEKDKALLSVSMNFRQTKKGGMIVKSIVGNNLDGVFETAEDFSAPTVRYICAPEYIEKMPYAGVGVAYPIPEISATDWFFGECKDINKEIYRYNEADGAYTTKVETDLWSGAFTPTEAGKYAIVYTSKNPFAMTVSNLTFEVIEELPAIVAVLSSDYETPVLMQSLTIPNVQVLGGSGIIDVQETLYYNGKEIPLNQLRTVEITEAGIISLRVECKGYTGETVVRYFPVEIKDNTVLIVEELPLLLWTGKQTVFPQAIAYDSATGAPATVKISVDGVELDEHRTYTPTKTSGNLKVKYEAQSASGIAVKTYDIPVRDISQTSLSPAAFMVAEEGMTVSESNTGVLLQTGTTGAEAYWAYPVVTGYSNSAAYVNVSVTENKKNFEYLDVVFSDYANPTAQTFVRVYRECAASDSMFYLQINGTGSKFLVDGSLNDENSLIRFYINTGSGYVYNAVSHAVICELPDFKAEACKISFRLGGVTGVAGVEIKQIGNQALNSRDTGWLDRQGPMIAYDFALKRDCYMPVGREVKLPRARAFDLLSASSSLEVSVTDPTGQKTALTGKDAFSLEKVGTYSILYKATDENGKVTLDEYYYYAIDQIAPTLTISKTIAKTLKAGSTITLPNAIAKDNLEGELPVYVYIRFKRDMSMVEMKIGNTYVFTTTGNYEIRYFTHDSDYNYAEYIMYVTVTE